jgi:hypothetical protein
MRQSSFLKNDSLLYSLREGEHELDLRLQPREKLWIPYIMERLLATIFYDKLNARINSL